MAAEAFQDLVGDIDYPMYIVTCRRGAEMSGCLVGFATQCSLDPARFLVCVSKANHTHDTVTQTSVAAVHFPRGDDLSLAKLFGEQSGDEIDKFAECSWTQGVGGAPVLDDVRGWFVGRILERWSAGDHTALLMEPVASAVVDLSAPPLTFRHVRDLEPGHPA